MIKRYFSVALILMTVVVTEIKAQKIPLYIGTYTEKGGSKGIYTFSFDTETADVTLLSETETPSPSFIARKNELLLAVNELTDGNQSISAFQIEGARLKFLNKLPTTGSAPCHVLLDPKGKYAIVSNYLGGTLDIYGIDPQKGLIGHEGNVKFEGSGPNKKRQDAPHIHSTFFGKDNHVYVSDLGSDQIYEFQVQKKDGKHALNLASIIKTPAGAGPRHLAFHPKKKIFYAIMEMTADVLVYEKENDTWVEKQRLNMNGEGFSGNSGAADIKVSKDGRFVYATDRVDANNITSFKVLRDGTLDKIQVQSVLGKGPRNFNFSPDEKFVLVGNQISNEVVIFKRDKKTGLLTDSGKRINAFKPVCLIF